MIIFPQAKINLGLHVLKKCEDSYHEVETCMYSIPLFDILEILPADEFSFKQTGLVVDGTIESNLCVKAFRLFEKEFKIPNVYMHLRKQIPMGAGLGGGSSDAAHAINGLNELFAIGISQSRKEEFAAQLGSDCAFFIDGSPKLATGRGEKLEYISVDLKGKHLLLIYPDIHVGTAEAYAGVDFYQGSKSINEILNLPITEWQNQLENSFEKSIFGKYPVMLDIKNKLIANGALYAAMSGSGSTLFGIFEKEPEKLELPLSNQQFCLQL
jgi:4-diphosphocytidyl-2-C-methyl-D-erythritol kinase